MVFDLHSHTYYSGCGRDEPHLLVQAAAEQGVELLGITDHNYGIGTRKAEYLREMRAVAADFHDRLRVLCGIEIATLPQLFDLADPSEIAAYDYALIEHMDNPDSLAWDDFFGFCKRLGIPCGIAHTDLFAYCAVRGLEPLSFFKELAANGIFWEMNVNYDSIHGFRTHPYVARFVTASEEIATVRESDVAVSVGFDSHRAEEYDGERVQRMCAFLEQSGIRTADEFFTNK